MGKNPTDRGKLGTPKSLLTDCGEGSLGIVVAGANVVDEKLLKATIEAIVVERPDPAEDGRHLCLDKGYDSPNSTDAVAEEHYIPHVRRIGEAKKSRNRMKGEKVPGRE
jgi:putative transposase